MFINFYAENNWNIICSCSLILSWVKNNFCTFSLIQGWSFSSSLIAGACVYTYLRIIIQLSYNTSSVYFLNTSIFVCTYIDMCACSTRPWIKCVLCIIHKHICVHIHTRYAHVINFSISLKGWNLCRQIYLT